MVNRRAAHGKKKKKKIQFFRTLEGRLAIGGKKRGAAKAACQVGAKADQRHPEEKEGGRERNAVH